MLNELETEVATGRGILDSRGSPIVKAGVCPAGGATERAAIPSDISTGKFEAVELRDGRERYNGQGVKETVEHVNSVLSEVVSFESTLDQRRLNQTFLDAGDAENRGKLEVNAVLSVSMAVAEATASGLHMLLYHYLGGVYASQLPIPMMNTPNEGKYADNTADLQEFMTTPYGACCFSERLRMYAEVYHTLKKLLREDGYSTGVGDEGGFAPNLKNSEEVLEYLVKAMGKSGLKPDTDVKIATDATSGKLYDKVSGMYLFPGESRMISRRIYHNAGRMVGCRRSLVERLPTYSIEDGLEEEDWEGWKMLTGELRNRIQLVGDDLFVTNIKRPAKGIEMEAGNVILVKVSQIGTLTESFEVIEIARWAGFDTIVSHRSGETKDSIIADIAVAVNIGQIKTGVPCRPDRTAKYSQLLRVKENLTPEVRPTYVFTDDLLPALHRLGQCTQPVYLTNLYTAGERSSHRFKCQKGGTR